jgi:hypothetical protein
MKSTHSQRIERWLGIERTEQISRSMRGWYGAPITLLDVPGSVRVGADGDFTGPFEHGFFASALDKAHELLKRASRVQHGVTNVGFASISDALLRNSSGFGQSLSGNISKVGPTGVVGVTSSLWRVGNQPAGGAAPGAAPGGRVPTSATAGAMTFVDPATGTLHLVGADMGASVGGNSLLLYDRIFDVAKTMNSTALESVTGAPTRYQSSVATAADYIGGNFLFFEVGGTALAAVAHNWDAVYTNQANAGAQALPQLVGNSGAIVDRLDHPAQQWFAPLGANSGIKKIDSITCSALVTSGLINAVIGHPIGVLAFPFTNGLWPFDFLTNRNQAPRIFNGACLAALEICKPSTTATNYNGVINVCSAAP